MVETGVEMITSSYPVCFTIILNLMCFQLYCTVLNTTQELTVDAFRVSASVKKKLGSVY